MTCSKSAPAAIWNNSSGWLLLSFRISYFKQLILCANPQMWRSIGKGVLFEKFDVKVQVKNVPELWCQMFWKVYLFLW